MSEIKLKSVFLRIPEKEYIKMKTFMLFNGISMQMLIRSAIHYYIEEVKKAKKA